jgi:hypothetical protein
MKASGFLKKNKRKFSGNSPGYFMGFWQFSDESIGNKPLHQNFSIICKNSLFLARNVTIIPAQYYPYGFSAFSKAYLVPQVQHKWT